MRCRLTIAQDTTDGPKPAGTEIDHPHAFRLVELGVAESVDDECRAAEAAWQERMKKRSPRQKELDQLLRKAQRNSGKRAAAELAADPAAGIQ